MKPRWWLIFAVIVGVAGCSSSKPSKDDGTYYLAAFEDFDESEHPDVVPPPPPIESGHDIPDGLEGPGGIETRKQGRGYRIQLYASRDKADADAQVERAIGWWERSHPEDAGGDHPPVYIDYEQPYYKVRLGDYRNRSGAATDADKVGTLFRGAFVVPATINLR